MGIAGEIMLAVALAGAQPGQAEPEHSHGGHTEAEAPGIDMATPALVDVETQSSDMVLLPKDTPIHMMVTAEVTTKTHGAGHRFRLRVTEPVAVDGRVLVPIGATAWGEVTSAERSGNIGKSGQLSARLLFVDLDGKRVPVSGERTDKGKSGTAETVMGVIGLGLFGLLAKGNNAKLKAGEMFTAFTSEDVTFAASPAS